MCAVKHFVAFDGSFQSSVWFFALATSFWTATNVVVAVVFLLLSEFQSTKTFPFFKRRLLIGDLLT